MSFIQEPTRYLFFTGKGGVGKTSLSCATAIHLADHGKRVLLVSTDPASNLDEVLETPLSGVPTSVAGVPGLVALNVDPEEAARVYRERLVGPYRNVLPAATVASIEEQLSGACTMEIAAFDEFSGLLGNDSSTEGYDHVIFDTAPTGHTLRLLELPAAWTGFLEENTTGTSCLGPLAGLQERQALYARTRDALKAGDRTTLVLVARPDPGSLSEADRARHELAALGVTNLTLALNGLFRASDREDRVALAMEVLGQTALDRMPDGLRGLPRMEFPLLPMNLKGLPALRALVNPSAPAASPAQFEPLRPIAADGVAPLLDSLASPGTGVVMVMGKGGVGKTTVATMVALDLARRGLQVHLTTTDPAGSVSNAPGGDLPNLTVSRIDADAETRAYRDEVMATAGASLDEKGRALLEEDLRSPCTEEVAVFRAFAQKVEQGEAQFVVIDTAPTGHTLLLLDSAEAYHREVLKRPSGSPEAVKRLLPRLRDPGFTRVLIVTLPESTPVHEAMALEKDLLRAGIRPFAWIVNQSLTPLALSDPLLLARSGEEARYLTEVERHATRTAVVPWNDSELNQSVPRERFVR